MAELSSVDRPGGLRRWIRHRVTPRQLVWLRCVTRGYPWPRWGNLRRTRPFSDNFGFERGTAVDRFYLHRFLEEHRPLITGRVLEIQMPGYATRYGHDLTATDSVDIAAGIYSDVTYLTDLAQSQDIVPSASYDCFLLPNTLCVMRDIEGCLRQALRVVKPGGVILATSAAFVPLTGDCPDYWHLSAAGWRELAARAWPDCEVRIEQHGNCLTATAAMLGLALEELTQAEFEYDDPRFPVLVTLFCRRPE